MIETLILSLLCGLLGGLLGYAYSIRSIPIIKTKNGYIRYIKGDNTEFITVMTKMAKNYSMLDLPLNKSGVTYIKYATKI